jgi:trafficking protein particle complex subunit 8
MDGKMRCGLERECRRVLFLLTRGADVLTVQYTASRRLPSRLFSSTRRLFGSSYSAGAASPAPGSPRTSHSSSGSVSSIASASTLVGGTEPLQQHRRLAEFATILGDLKLSVAVWENLRKEGRGGSVTILLSNSHSVPDDWGN